MFYDHVNTVYNNIGFTIYEFSSLTTGTNTPVKIRLGTFQYKLTITKPIMVMVTAKRRFYLAAAVSHKNGFFST